MTERLVCSAFLFLAAMVLAGCSSDPASNASQVTLDITGMT
jgi:predicted component of type VI protein secretion system